MTKMTSSTTISHATPVKANTGKLVVKNKILGIGKEPPVIALKIEAIKSGICLDSNNGVVDLIKSRIKSGVRLDSVNSYDGVVNLVIPVNYNY